MDKPLSPLARIVLLGAGALAVIAGPILYLLPEHTAVYFAWHIQQPLTPVFMGAFYLAGIGNFAAVAILDALIGIALFLLPQPVAPLWPWSLTPLTARVIGGWHLGGAALKVMLARQHTLATAWVGLLANAITVTLLLIGAWWHRAHFDGPVLTTALYLLMLVTNGGISIYAWWRATRPTPVPT